MKLQFLAILVVVGLCTVSFLAGAAVMTIKHDVMESAQAAPRDDEFKELKKDYMQAVIEIRKEMHYIVGAFSPRAKWGISNKLAENTEALRENTAALKGKTYKTKKKYGTSGMGSMDGRKRGR